MGTITVTNLGKAYKQYPTRWSRLAEWLIPFSKPRHQLKWVLQDISFKVNPGEAVGIIGINGAGKSTLLKMITGTTQPTTGSVHITGRVAAMLELGMGFHPDFTGRQNVYMAGQLLGMSIEEITRLMPEIEAFAEIGDYIDQPVRVYSSGMQMRVAFSVATARRPDVLIVDEALSVGDTYFQHKSFDRIRQFSRQGTTLLFVSHDAGAIQSICDRAIMLDAGKIGKAGEPEAIMDYYNAMIAQKENSKIEQTLSSCGKIQTTSGTGEVKILSAVILNDKDEPVEVINVGENITLKVTAVANAQLPELVLGYLIKDRLGITIFGTNTYHLGSPLKQIEANERVNYQFSFPANLGEGSYSITIAFHSANTHLSDNFVWKDRVIIFNVVNMNKKYFTGVVWLPPEWESHRGRE
jgi:lipopolysaccharide transport system ATP-binding protein